MLTGGVTGQEAVFQRRGGFAGLDARHRRLVGEEPVLLWFRGTPALRQFDRLRAFGEQVALRGVVKARASPVLPTRTPVRFPTGM